MEHTLRNALHALLERPDATLRDILRLLTDKRFRIEVAKGIQNEVVREFWLREYEHYSFGYRADGAGSIQNKVGALLADPTLQRIFTNPTEDIRIRKIMDEGRILLVNLAKGRIGEGSSNLLGALLVTTISLAAFSRADTPA